MQGFVKFFKADRGWGVIVSLDVERDVWVHSSHIEGAGLHEFQAGDVVEFDVEGAEQAPFCFRATRAALLRHGPPATLRRVGDRVVVAEPGAPDTSLTSRSQGRSLQPPDGT